MSLDQLVLAVGTNDADRVDAMARIVTDIAGPTGATVSLAHMFTEEEYADIRDRLGIDKDAEHTPETVARRRDVIRTLERSFEEDGIDYEVYGRVGDPGEEVVGLAKRMDADLIAVGGRNRSPVGKAVFGSTAQQIMLDAPCPVMFVKAEG